MTQTDKCSDGNVRINLFNSDSTRVLSLEAWFSTNDPPADSKPESRRSCKIHGDGDSVKGKFTFGLPDGSTRAYQFQIFDYLPARNQFAFLNSPKNGIPACTHDNPIKTLGGKTVPEQRRILIETALRKAGQPATRENVSAVYTIVEHESSWNPRAINNWDKNARKGTPSKGLMQTIEPTFARYSLPGFRNIFKPLDNLIAGIRYAVDRYGSLKNVPGIRSLSRNRGNRMASNRGYVGY